MGGSHLGTQLINSVYRDKIKIPVEVHSRYKNPGYLSKNTLVICTSFSGNTEEVISFTKDALDKKAKVICISSNGEVEKIAKKHDLPRYIFKSTHNQSEIPRYGSGYLFISQLVFLTKIGAISFTKKDFNSVIEILKQQQNKYGLSIKSNANPAKIAAFSLQNTIPVLVASEHLMGSAHIFKNQINESAKNFAVMHEIPELNHHLLEGLKYPESNQTYLNFFFLESNLYFDRNQKRHAITKDIIKNQGISTHSFKPKSQSKLTQAFETLSFTSYVTLYLSILNKVDPGPNPWVDHLKNQLK